MLKRFSILNRILKLYSIAPYRSLDPTFYSFYLIFHQPSFPVTVHTFKIFSDFFSVIYMDLSSLKDLLQELFDLQL